MESRQIVGQRTKTPSAGGRSQLLRTSEIPCNPPASALPSRLLMLAGVLFALVPVAMVGDLSLEQALQQDRLPSDLRRLLTWSEVTAHGLGVACLALLVFVLDPTKRPALARVLALAYGGGLGANVGKLLVARFRPRDFDGLHAWDSFVGLLPPVRPIPGYGSWADQLQSFPSAHVATATGFALGMARLYPRGRVLFCALLGLAAAQRLAVGAHFFSDAVAGTAVGLLVGAALMPGGIASSYFDRREGLTV